MNIINKIKSGFNLLEVLIVVTIIGTLSTVAIPQYKEYQKGVILGSVMHSLAQKKTEIVICYQKNGDFDNCDYSSDQLKFLTDKDYVQTLTIENGVINILLNILDDNNVNISLTLRPVVQGGILVYFSEEGNYCDYSDIKCNRRL